MQQGAATNYAQRTVSDWPQARAFALEVGFPSHGVVVGRPGTHGFSKDCNDWPAWEQQVRMALAAGPVWLETDMRAHRNPTRMAMIASCAGVLSRLLQTPCPACRKPGFGEEAPIAGAVCEGCGAVTDAMRAKRIRCTACAHSEVVELQATVAPSRCAYCNP